LVEQIIENSSSDSVICIFGICSNVCHVHVSYYGIVTQAVIFMAQIFGGCSIEHTNDHAYGTLCCPSVCCL